MMKAPGFLRHTTVMFLILAAGISAVLFSVKYQVHELEDTHDRLIAELADEKRALHVLEAEWETLNDPVRIQKLAVTHLGMAPVAPQSVVGVSAILEIPVRQVVFERQEGQNERDQ